ncbi:Tissue alpha-L-fucosidase [Seminavis robusta]|uniref:alpha-L-fucosidase n=1 Tax=Seminavis robusta TaxID=568900 RepID=A0A9N8F1B8_9STRA|nr:Tissue alpha-L-fucosidase [Seminavis robusta]|eukprot:Sro2255_g321000.1 Tissue alpha-L-fucosidase (503) ;mRNA; r:12396-13904
MVFGQRIKSLLLLFTLQYPFKSGGVLGFEATWESLDSRPLPNWYDEAKFGIFIHWGVFSVPSYKGEWFWQKWGRNGDAPSTNQATEEIKAFVNKTELPQFAYADYAHRFDATLYDPEHWAGVFAQSGAQYVVLTSKHHEGFCNWDSRQAVPTSWNWNSVEVGPKRDLVGELAHSVKKTMSNQTQKPLRFGLYHSLYEWFNPLYEHDKANKFQSQTFVKLKTMPELYDIVEKYQPEVIWSDGDWDAHSDYWDSKQFLAWYATNSTVAKTGVWNDRWGKDAMCHHGSFLTCQDRYLPDKINHHKWENALTITSQSWGYDRSLTLKSYYTAEYLIHALIQTVAYNGNMLLNVGPRADGTLDPIFEERLTEIGSWLSVNGDAIYGSRPWNHTQHEPASKVFYTVSQQNKVLYALFTEWPEDSKLQLKSPVPTESTKVHMLGLPSARKESIDLRWSHRGEASKAGMTIQLPALTPRNIPCQYAWILALTGIGNLGEEDVAEEESVVS